MFTSKTIKTALLGTLFAASAMQAIPLKKSLIYAGLGGATALAAGYIYGLSDKSTAAMGVLASCLYGYLGYVRGKKEEERNQADNPVPTKTEAICDFINAGVAAPLIAGGFAACMHFYQGGSARYVGPVINAGILMGGILGGIFASETSKGYQEEKQKHAVREALAAGAAQERNRRAFYVALDREKIELGRTLRKRLNYYTLSEYAQQ